MTEAVKRVEEYIRCFCDAAINAMLKNNVRVREFILGYGLTGMESIVVAKAHDNSQGLHGGRSRKMADHFFIYEHEVEREENLG